MATKVKVSIAKFIEQAGRDRYPEEACGFVVRKGKKTYAIEVANEAHPSVRKQQFLINPSAYIKAEAEHGEIISVWHTHVEEPPTPSQADKAGCETSGLNWLITSVYKRENEQFEFSEPTLLTPNGEKTPHVGRPYVFGVFDCWSLVVDYMRDNHNIALSNEYPRIDKFWINEKPFFDDHYQDEDLIQVTDGTYKDGDVLMFQTDGSQKINHVGVYIGDGKFLHHIEGRASTVDVYGGYWLKHTTLHLRHKSKC